MFWHQQGINKVSTRYQQGTAVFTDAHLWGGERVVGNFHDEVGPDDVEHEEDGEQPVEYVVGREHLHHLGGFNSRAAHKQAGS